MAGEWQMDALEDLIDVKHGFAFAGDCIHDEPRGDVLLTPGNFAIGGGFKGDKLKYYDGPVPDEFVLREGDLLVTMTDLSKQADTLGYPAFVPASRDGRRYLHNQRLGKVLLKKPTTIDARYLYYVLRGQEYRHEVLASATGTTVKHTSPERIRRFRFLRAPRNEQLAIAHILGTLDDKIELNRQMNESLEAMARALFNSWFVDFDPVRAKVEGRDPGLPKLLADLFPARLVDSEFGEIPEGWHEGSFGSFISQRSERVGRREVVVFSAIASGKLAKSDDHFTKRVYSKETDKYLVVEQWDFAYNPSRINIGSIGMLEEEILGGVSPVYVVVRPKPAYRSFLAFSIRRAHTKTWINTLASGSVRQSLSYTDFASIPCVVPPQAVAHEFNQRWSTFREGIRSREAESRALATLRDTLLPKLISGELRVKNAERFNHMAV